MRTAPFASVEVMMTGSISGVRPTAIVMENRSASPQSPFVKPLMSSTTGTMTSMSRIKRLLTESTPRSKLFFARSPDRDFAMEPK